MREFSLGTARMHRARVIVAAIVGACTFAVTPIAAQAGAPKPKPPGPATNVQVKALDGAFLVSWSPAPTLSSTPVDSYTATATSKGLATVSCTSSSTHCLIKGIVDPAGKSKNLYGVAVTAHNRIGTGKAAKFVGKVAGAPGVVSYPGADFTGIDLAGRNFDSANLGGANLTGSTLTGASLRGANLQHAWVRRARLGRFVTAAPPTTHADKHAAARRNTRASITPGADLTGADLSGVDLSNTDMSGVTCTNASFVGALLSHVTFDGASCAGADFTNAVFVGAFASFFNRASRAGRAAPSPSLERAPAAA